MIEKKNMSKKMTAVAVVMVLLAAVLVAAAIWLFVSYKGTSGTVSEQKKDVMATSASDTVVPTVPDDSGTIRIDESNVIYFPSSDTLQYSKTDYISYYRDLIEVFTLGEVSPSRQDELAALVGGEIVGMTSGAINTLQIRTDAAGLDDIKAKSEVLMREADVLYASFEIPVRLDESTADPWSADPSAPQSKDWWAEAIGAEKAWEIADSDAYRSNPMKKIGIIDSGVDDSHVELSGKIERPSAFASSSPADHGTAVAGFAAAKGNNGAGIRGVSDRSGLTCIDYEKTHLYRDIMNSSTGFVAACNTLVKSGADVINISQSSYMYDKSYFNRNKSKVLEAYTEDEKKSIKNYDDYVRVRNSESFEMGLKCICITVSLLVNKYLNPADDFLLVQAAGNGYNNQMKVGSDVKYSGLFNAVDESIWNRLSKDKRTALAEYGITYKEIDDRIIVVGGIKNEKTGDNYKMSEVCYGDAVDICAPAEDLFRLKTVSNGSYSKKGRGTSFAAPLVSGAAALIWSLNPGLSAPEVKRTLLETSGSVAVCSHGAQYNRPVLNVGAAAKNVTQKHYVPNNIVIQDTWGDTSRKTVIELSWLTNSLTVKNDGSDFQYSFDGSGKIENGENTDKNGNTLTHSFSYAGDVLSSLELTEQHRVTDDYTERLDSRATLNSFGKPEYLLEQYLTSGAEANITYSQTGQVTAASFDNYDVPTELHYYYEDVEHPDRLTRTEITQTRFKGTMVMSYSYNENGTVDLITTKQKFSRINMEPSDCSASFEYDTDGNLSVFSLVSDNGNDKSTVSIRFTYEIASEAQYNAFQSLSACSFNGIYPDLYLPFGPVSNCFPSVNVLIRP